MADTVFIRASSFGALFDCPYRWTAIYREGLKTPTSLPAVLGTAIHKGTALFDSEKLAGQIPNLSAAMDAARDHFKSPGEEVAYAEDDKPDQATDIAVSLTEKYATEFAPTVEYAAVELKIDGLEIKDLGITLTGTTDRVRKTEEGLGIADLKSGKTAVEIATGKAKTAGHALQLGVYELIATAGMGIPMEAAAQVIGLQTNVTRDKQRIGTGEVWRPREILTGDEQNEGVLVTAAKFAKGEVVYGNPKSNLCHVRFCPRFSTCWFRR